MTDEQLDIAHFRTLLLEERRRLETELSRLARRNPKQEGGWEAIAPDMNVQESDPSEQSDRTEEFENITGAELALEEELGRVNAAMERIANGTYGTCTEGKERIPRERLEVNPAAETCVEHQTSLA